MSRKMIVLNEETRVLFNKAKANIIKANPTKSKFNDDVIIRIVLKKYLGVKNG